MKKADSIPAQDFIDRSNDLLAKSNQLALRATADEERQRFVWLSKQLVAMRTKVEMLGGKNYSFDEEASLLYDAEPPTFSAAYFDSLLVQLEELVPGEGDLSERIPAFTAQFIIPSDLVDTVFRVAIAEARKRTNSYFTLPSEENFELSYVNDKPWTGYNYYQGSAQSKIDLNMDFPVYIQRVIDLACHEGYPGHHVFMTLLDQNLYVKKGWPEFSVYLLFSPQSLLAEGSANYGIDVAFPGEERIRYEKEVLFPLAGLDAEKAEQYYQLLEARSRLSYAGNEAARNYLNGELSREEAAAWLTKYNFSSPERSLQRTRFFDTYRSYVINYNLGKDLVDQHMTALGGTVDNPEKRWELFKDLISNPYTPSGLEK